jgi:hypothetical protein
VDYKELRKYLVERNIVTRQNESPSVRGYDLDSYQKLALQTEKVDYGCDFHDGVCYGQMIGTNGCCFKCGDTFGYSNFTMRAQDSCVKARVVFYRGSCAARPACTSIVPTRKCPGKIKPFYSGSSTAFTGVDPASKAENCLWQSIFSPTCRLI